MAGEKFLKFVLSFLLGVVTGASVALLFAPSSGEELRANIKSQADVQYARLQEEYNRGLAEIQSRLDTLSSELESVTNRSK